MKTLKLFVTPLKEWPMPIKALAFGVALLLAACSPMVINYPSVCPDGDAKCQRNLDAQTLAIIGQPEAAEELMRTDPELADVIDTCSK